MSVWMQGCSERTPLYLPVRQKGLVWSDSVYKHFWQPSFEWFLHGFLVWTGKSEETAGQKSQRRKDASSARKNGRPEPGRVNRRHNRGPSSWLGHRVRASIWTFFHLFCQWGIWEGISQWRISALPGTVTVGWAREHFQWVWTITTHTAVANTLWKHHSGYLVLPLLINPGTSGGSHPLFPQLMTYR